MGTFASALHFQLPEKSAEDSHDLLPVIKGESCTARNTHIHNTFADKYAIRDGHWLLVDFWDGYSSGRNKGWEERRGYPADDKSRVELYNLKNDIGQKHNVALKNPQKVIALQSLLKKIREQGYSAPRLENK
jgi:arylsulfatase A